MLRLPFGTERVTPTARNKSGRALPPLTFLGGARGSRTAGGFAAGQPVAARSTRLGHARATRFTALHVVGRWQDFAVPLAA